MIDLAFRIASLEDFMADLDQFCTDTGWPQITAENEDGRYLPDHRVYKHLRIDIDYIADLVGVPAEFDDEGNILKPAIMRGPHVNMRLSLVHDTDEARVTLDAVSKNIQNWFASATEAGTDTPQEMLDRLGISEGDIKAKQQRTQRGNGLLKRKPGSQVLRQPKVPKRVFA